ncbi:acetolactate synthase III, valine-sensitive, catalytic (large) subunit [Campylobacter subantarcticus LMG 24377]|uniref:Acetolactate synthase n=1 Tax=Campylobacter subantarcticus TaxID=497724 RepID=A0ABW9N6Z8_9BACT|nr:acetolactate synthase III, valine-sensitive, catalytic subunit [Campylobacter subantarcticus]AJC92474.1 acetolactate synthase III, valine-sensitive, catalytic (large) subunit [Campylobacter subantarcticus LMG 24377]EAL3939522.1 acetolactate synthase III, valine-sensitive, catalytic subunit [Campylobacter lari]MPC00045.1 acetolactate synthase III, valine-sensitive, catalytic subunit [Campylobacter subantarcticus]
MKELNGSQMICETLKEENVKVVFGYPGGAALNIYDEIYKQTYFKHILVRHEQAALHSADAYARMSGEVGVAVVTSGPGFTNTVTGLATAYSDSIPLVLISAQVANSLIGTDAFQEIDAIGISRPCVKHNYLVKNIEELPRILKEAFYIATTGRKGPVHIDIPKDVTAATGVWDYPKEIFMKTYKPTYRGNIKQIKKLVSLIKNSQKPLFYLGGGCIASNASDALRELIHFCQIPAVETLMALGTLRSDDELNLKMAGMHGSYCANIALSECDLLIAVGARFDDRITGKTSEFAKSAKIVHIDIDPSSISKIIEAHYPIVGDIKSVIMDTLEELKKENLDQTQYQEWFKTLQRYQQLYPLSYEDSDEVLKPQWVIEECARLAPDARIITDVGQHQMWVAQFYPFNYTRQLATSGGQGTMGYSLPAALGTKLAVGEEVVVNFVGDGSFLMNIQELMTASAYGIKVINIILNNSFLGMVRQWQSMFYKERFSNTDLSIQPDFVGIARGFHCEGCNVFSKEEFQKAFQKALESDKTYVLNVAIDRYEDVLPMVPAGGAIYNMILPSFKNKDKK